jgi:GTP-binding protein HflX
MNEMDDKNAVIVSLQRDNEELRHLARALEYHVQRTFIQQRDTPDPASYIGAGKIAEVAAYIGEHDIDCAIVDQRLRPSQWYTMEKELNVTVYDRIRLILNIFADRAQRKEAKLQVRLASLRYERPYVRELIHRARTGEHPGFMAGGQYEVANYYEMIKKQMKNIKEDLDKTEKVRESHRKNRREKGFYLVSIAGYTNAGKSSLLNQLSDEEVAVEERLFSTLSTTTRRLKHDRGTHAMPILITDTVGFIRDLPHWLVDAFHPTLEEIALSDVIVLLIDASESLDTIREKASVSLREIMEMENHPDIIVGMNKADRLTGRERQAVRSCIEGVVGNRPCLFLSARTGDNLGELVDEIYRALPDRVEMDIVFPDGVDEDDMSFIFNQQARICRVSNDGSSIVRVTCSERVKDKITGRCRQRGAEVRQT